MTKLPGKIDHVLCLGNVGDNSVLTLLKSLSPDFQFVLGDCDRLAGVPTKKKLDINGVKIGLIHGHQIFPWDDPEALKNVEREIECDILLHGHTHRPALRKLGHFHAVNPGSATGAFSALDMYSWLTSSPDPSFMLLQIEATKLVTVFHYSIPRNDPAGMKVTKSAFQVIRQK